MGGAYFVIVLALVLGVMYVVMIRPQRKYQHELRTRVASADVGDDILTNGGIYGTIVAVEGDDIEVEIAKGVTVHMTRHGITAVLPPEEQGHEEDEAEEDEAEDDELRERVAHEG